MIDLPIAGLIDMITKIPFCFTLQSCYGHFIYPGQADRRSTQRLPLSDNLTIIEYKIAYVALCIENSLLGKDLLNCLQRIPAIDPQYIQFGCADWFWKRQVNSYVLQVESSRYMTRDAITINYREALHIEKVRDAFFARLRQVVLERVSSI